MLYFKNNIDNTLRKVVHLKISIFLLEDATIINCTCVTHLYKYLLHLQIIFPLQPQHICQKFLHSRFCFKKIKGKTDDSFYCWFSQLPHILAKLWLTILAPKRFAGKVRESRQKVNRNICTKFVYVANFHQKVRLLY